MIPQSGQDLLLSLTLIAMLIGLVGILLPMVPGTILIFAAALLYAWLDNFQAVGWPTLIVLGVLTVLATTGDIWATSLGAKAGGASGWSMLAGLVGGVVGMIVLSLPGAIIGSILGVLLVEVARVGDWHRALKAGGGWLIGWLFSVVLQVVVGLVMIAIFYWQATGPR